MKLPLFLMISIALVMVTLAISSENESDSVEIAVLSEKNWDKFVPHGKEVDAIYGDIVLRNKTVVAVIARPVATRNANMTVRNVGGCLIDLTSRAYESDQLSCFYPAGTDYAYRDFSVAIDAEESKKITEGDNLKGKSGRVTVIAQGTDGRPAVQTTYLLTEDGTNLEIMTEYRNDLKKTITVVPMDYIRADGGKEEMVKTPNGTTERFSITDEYWQQSYLLTTSDQVQCNSNSRTSTLKYIAKDGSDFKSLAPDSSVKLTRKLAVGRTAFDALQAANQGEFWKGKIILKDREGERISQAVLQFKKEGEPTCVVRANDKGVAVSAFPGETRKLEILHNGQLIFSAVDLDLQKRDDGETSFLVVKDYSPGSLQVTVKNQSGTSIPAKLEIVGIDGTATPYFGPETAEFAVRNLRYTPNGDVQQLLASGKYLIRTSHGPEYSADEQIIEVSENQTTAVSVTLNHVIDTTGWVSTDYHSHSTPSGDNTSSQRGRILNLVCENIEFAPCTEHNRIDTYQHSIDELKIQNWISSISGMELTGSPLPLNHQNVFPLHHHPHRQDGGGPVTDGDVNTQVRRLATWDNNSEKLIQQDHPDIGWLVYDKDGDGKYDEGHADGVSLLDAMEIHPIDRALQTGSLTGMTAEAAKSNRVFKWLQLLNQGYRIPGVVNTDAHYNFHGSGWIRNWVQCSTDDPAKIDAMEIVHASEAGRIVMSNGPFLKMSVTNGTGKVASVGEDLAAPGKEVTVEVSVQCPNWHSIDTVFILLNGQPRPELRFTVKDHPDLFKTSGEGAKLVQVFHKNIPLKLVSDTHIVAVAGGMNSSVGPVAGPGYEKDPPTALTNPVFVDTDGDGFTPNKETLGRPLPVKGD